jgi:hypothetical protein
MQNEECRMTSETEEKNKKKQIAFAIDSDAEVGEMHNPCVMAVPIGLQAQEVLVYIYKGYIAEELQGGTEPEDIPHHCFTYLWYGEIIGNSRVSGCECSQEYGSIQPPDRRTFERMVEEVRKELEASSNTTTTMEGMG